MPRILCLHGLGTSSAILEAQTGSFRSLLPDSYDFEFVDGTVDCKAADGVAGVFPGPYFAYYAPPMTYNVEAAHEELQAIIDEEGPFDGVMGFSQGAALSAGFLLRQRLEDPTATPPFRFAIFLCASLPLLWNADHGLDISSQFAHYADTRDRTDTISTIIPATPLKDANGKDIVVRRMEPDVDTVRISIPTAHVMGKRDAAYGQSLRLLGLCQKSLASVWEDSFGHEVPKRPEQSRKIVELIEEVVMKNEFMH